GGNFSGAPSGPPLHVWNPSDVSLAYDSGSRKGKHPLYSDPLLTLGRSLSRAACSSRGPSFLRGRASLRPVSRSRSGSRGGPVPHQSPDSVCGRPESARGTAKRGRAGECLRTDPVRSGGPRGEPSRTGLPRPHRPYRRPPGRRDARGGGFAAGRSHVVSTVPDRLQLARIRGPRQPRPGVSRYRRKDVDIPTVGRGVAEDRHFDQADDDPEHLEGSHPGPCPLFLTCVPRHAPPLSLAPSPE